ncbi:MAG: PAS domain S-box protein [Acidobacteria bacterium]|nr:PAS domain S-box protein [Acidobacteriota bacterium]
MHRLDIVPTGREVSFREDEIIVSKTDLHGIIRYANDVFIRVSGYSESELIGQPHSILRHPDMPRAVFSLLWETIKARRELFAYVVNLTRSGDHYWVFAHVTPSFDLQGQHVGYHSNRRVPHPDALAAVRTLYASLLAEERRHPNRQAAIDASTALLHQQLRAAGTGYDEFVFGLSRHTRLASAAA